MQADIFVVIPYLKRHNMAGLSIETGFRGLYTVSVKSFPRRLPGDCN